MNMYRIIRMKSKQRLAELENLAETDPEAAAHQIEMLHRNILSLFMPLHYMFRAAKFWNDLTVNVKKAQNIAIFKNRLDIHIESLAYTFSPVFGTLQGF